MSGLTAVLFFAPQFFLMERAGRRRLLLTGFISIAVCNLLMTIVDSVLVRSFHICAIVIFICAGKVLLQYWICARWLILTFAHKRG